MVKLRFLAGLAFHLAEAIGRSDLLHVQAQIGELVANAELVSGLVRAGAQEVTRGTTRGLPHRSLAATLWVLIPQAQMRAAEVIRQLSGSGLIMTPTERDFANPEIAGYLDKYLRGKDTIGARSRAAVQTRMGHDRRAVRQPPITIRMVLFGRSLLHAPALLPIADVARIQSDG